MFEVVKSAIDRRWGSLITVLAIGLCVACAKERGIQPLPADQLLYLGMRGDPPVSDAYVLVLETDEDSVIDSLPIPGSYGSYWLSTSPAGDLMAVHPGAPIQFWDLASRSLDRQLPMRALSALFLPDTGLVLITTLDSTLVYSTTDYELADIYHHELAYARHIPGTNQIMGIDFSSSPDRLLIYDYGNRTLVDSIIPLRTPHSSSPDIFSFELSPTGRMVYALILDSGGGWAVGYDLTSRAVAFASPYEIHGSVGMMRVNLTESQVWLTHGSNPFGYPWPEIVTVIDAITGTTIDTIWIGRDQLNWPHAIAPTDIRFHSHKNKAYVTCGSSFSQNQPVVVIDTKSRAISNVLFDDASRMATAIEIAPRP